MELSKMLILFGGFGLTISLFVSAASGTNATQLVLNGIAALAMSLWIVIST